MQKQDTTTTETPETPDRAQVIEAIRQHGVSEESSYLIRSWKRSREAEIRNITDEDEADRATTLLNVEETLIFFAAGSESAEDAVESLNHTRDFLAVGEHQTALKKSIDLCIEQIETGVSDIEQLLRCFNANTTLQ